MVSSVVASLSISWEGWQSILSDRVLLTARFLLALGVFWDVRSADRSKHARRIAARHVRHTAEALYTFCTVSHSSVEHDSFSWWASLSRKSGGRPSAQSGCRCFESALGRSQSGRDASAPAAAGASASAWSAHTRPLRRRPSFLLILVTSHPTTPPRGMLEFGPSFLCVGETSGERSPSLRGPSPDPGSLNALARFLFTAARPSAILSRTEGDEGEEPPCEDPPSKSPPSSSGDHDAMALPNTQNR
mmetsp:Transcript_10858/g.30547  ORF Transcript_10858/g.30547 Transcript_10858/m.30547 type:complete len:246 (+) Transcript_10858:810-1547(+)